ncbi:hypothetical protein MNBD_NITROSPINAE03-1951 [hydrothermal vent metagenome]|uniref:4Fe-4S Mo/W bis-MGD-type domain-containing protein n=1 Tax=hydrothermal vent metagenome TaxID=652676 RepID=A0A3B1BAT7_9ZZZZ
MDRRKFLKLGGTVAASGLAGACGQVAKKIIPYVVPPDDGVNPVDGWYYATTCRMCNSGCGIVVRTVEGRAKKVEGNADHPINRGGVCARGQAAVQQLYHPERIRTPLRRKPDTKGSNEFEAISWEDGIAILAEKMKKAKGKGAFVMASDSTDVTAAISSRVLGKLGSEDFVAPDFKGLKTRLDASLLLHDAPSDPYYDMAHASFVFLLGADIFENSVSPVHYSWAFGQMRRGDPTHRGVLTYAGPRMSMTAAVADRFIAAKQGTLGVLALGVAHEALNMVEKNNLLRNIPRPTMARWFKTLENYSLEMTSKRTGVAVWDIKELAHKFMTHQPGIAIPGDDVSSHSNGLESLKAVEFLNMIVREVNREKGNLKIPDLPYDDTNLAERMKKYLGVPEKAREFKTMRDVTRKAEEGKISLGMIMNSDPVHSSPRFLDVAKALVNVESVVYFGCFLNDTTRYADLILPDHHFLESWSAQLPAYPHGAPIFNTQQPVVRPMYDTMATGEALLKAAGAAGLNIKMATQEEMIEKLIVEFRAEWPEIPQTLNDAQAWEFLLPTGGWRSSLRAFEPVEAPSTDRLWDVIDHLKVEDPVFSGELKHNFYLHPYETVTIGDGSVANLTWLQEMVEPINSLSWGFWVEINTMKAMELGIKQGDILKVTSQFGSIEAPASLYPGIGPDTLAMPFGYGHVSFGKASSGRGANALALIGDQPVGKTGDLAWRGVKVKIDKTGRRKDMVREGHPKGEFEGEVFQL